MLLRPLTVSDLAEPQTKAELEVLQKTTKTYIAAMTARVEARQKIQLALVQVQAALGTAEALVHLVTEAHAITFAVEDEMHTKATEEEELAMAQSFGRLSQGLRVATDIRTRLKVWTQEYLLTNEEFGKRKAKDLLTEKACKKIKS